MSHMLWTVFTDFLHKTIYNLPSRLSVLFPLKCYLVNKNAALTDKYGAKLGKYLVIYFKQWFYCPKASEILYKCSFPYFLFAIIFQTW